MLHKGEIRQRQKLDLTTTWWLFLELLLVSNEGARLHLLGWNVNEKRRNESQSCLRQLETDELTQTFMGSYSEDIKSLHSARSSRFYSWIKAQETAVYSNLTVWSPEKYMHWVLLWHHAVSTMKLIQAI